ncbi:TPA: hypothetical protein R1938_002551, partial [Staphylococcus delphini]|nr:hypothetical protein [Staphylococcus delphini]
MPIVKQQNQNSNKKTSAKKSKNKKKLTFNKIKRRPFEFGNVFTDKRSLMILLVLTILLAFLLVNTVVNIAFDISQLKQNMDVLSRIDIAIEIIKGSLLAIIKSPLSILHFEHFKSTLLFMFPLFLLISYRFYKLYRKYRN